MLRILKEIDQNTNNANERKHFDFNWGAKNIEKLISLSSFEGKHEEKRSWNKMI